MLPKTAELAEDTHEDFIAELIIEDEQAKMIEGSAKAVDATVA